MDPYPGGLVHVTVHGLPVLRLAAQRDLLERALKINEQEYGLLLSRWIFFPRQMKKNKPDRPKN